MQGTLNSIIAVELSLYMLTLNPGAIAAYGDFMKPEELRDFLRRAQQELEAAWPVLEAQCLAEDWVAVQKVAHRLKSVVGSVGCERLHHALHQWEGDLRAQPMRVPLSTDLDRLRATVAQTSAALHAAAHTP
jgi:HPt (histidine-containing phosphotransfer) domain-containing protein